jgi:hypothetical protein
MPVDPPIKTSGAVTKGMEEDIVVVSKQDLALVWAGTKTIYSGICGSNEAAASGYWFESGQVDIQPINDSGWGLIRVPELSEVHKLFVFPKMPNLQGAVDQATYANVESGIGGISGNVALVHYALIQGTSGFYSSGMMCWASGLLCANSGRFDLIAFGSIY